MSNENIQNVENVSIDSDIVETIIGADTKFKGSVKTDKAIRIDGEFEGTIESTSSVIVSETGKINGDVKCSTLILDGYGEGTAECTELMKFAPIGVYNGDITVKNIILVEGSKFDGKCTMIR